MFVCMRFVNIMMMVGEEEEEELFIVNTAGGGRGEKKVLYVLMFGLLLRERTDCDSTMRAVNGNMKEAGCNQDRRLCSCVEGEVSH